ncbi:MAG: glycosyltransferase family 9 protein [Chthoniobacterales bacterium]
MASGKQPDSILLIKPSSLGDVVHALPIAEALKTAYPESTLSWVVNAEWVEILQGNPFIDQVIVFPRKEFRGVSGMFRGWQWMRGLRKVHPNLAIDLQGLFRSAWMAYNSKCGNLIGLSDAREGATLFYKNTIAVKQEWHAVDRYLAVLDFLEIPRPAAPRFFLPEGKRPDGFTINTPYLLLHPFSRGDGKSLSPEVTHAFCEKWRNTPIVLVGRTTEDYSFPSNTLNLLNKTTLTELIWLIRNSCFMVSVDSGPMHLCAGTGNRLLSIHTWSDPKLVGPYSQDSWVWRDGNIQTVAEFRTPSSSGGRAFIENDLDKLIAWLSPQFPFL